MSFIVFSFPQLKLSSPVEPKLTAAPQPKMQGFGSSTLHILLLVWVAVLRLPSAEVAAAPTTNLGASPSTLVFEVRTDLDSSGRAVGSPLDTGDVSFYELDVAQHTPAQLLFNLSSVQGGEYGTVLGDGVTFAQVMWTLQLTKVSSMYPEAGSNTLLQLISMSTRTLECK